MTRALKILTILLLTVLLTWAGTRYMSDQGAIREYFASFPWVLSAFLFIAVYVLSSFVVLDLKDVLKIVAALVFGAVWSTLFIWIAELVNNVMLFHLAQRLGRTWLERKFNLKGRDVRLVEKMCGTGQVFVLRIIPLVPYRILDIAYGLTAISFRRYFTISALASPVRIFWLQAILAGVGGAVLEPQKLYAYLMAHPQLVQWSFPYILLSVIATIFVSRRIK